MCAKLSTNFTWYFPSILLKYFGFFLSAMVNVYKYIKRSNKIYFCIEEDIYFVCLSTYQPLTYTN